MNSSKPFMLRLSLFFPNQKERFEMWNDFVTYPDERHNEQGFRPLTYEKVLQVLSIKAERMARDMVEHLKDENIKVDKGDTK